MGERVWRKSSCSGGGNGDCLETAAGSDGRVLLRESDEPDVVVSATSAPWAGLVRAVQAGWFERK
ncbi:DUF397 domain-containing protein [Streptomyces sp. NPDC003077]|uniref:DUF397 domain-containing protein n=1 Tax=Streptomyces sp. NPDC003077 TaxID=3154443 RepID=UPI0033BAF22A